MFVIWKVLVWNLTAAFHGVHPRKDHNDNPWPKGSLRAKNAGTPLYKGYGLWVFGINPDLEYLQNKLGIPCYSFDKCCWMCPANKSDIPFTDPSPNSLWRKGKYTPEYNRKNPATKHQIMDVPGVVNETFCIETLHTNELGVVLHYIANVFFDQVYEKVVAGTTVAERVSNLWKTVLQIYADLKISSSDRIGKLTLEMFADGKAPHQNFPVLSQVKAKEARCLLPVAVKIAEITLEKRFNGYNVYCAQAGQACLRMYEVMDETYLHPTSQQRTDFRDACDTFQQMYAALASQSQKNAKKRWDTRTKSHYSAHAPDFFDFFNIKYTSAYGGETEVGLICALGHVCLDGTASHKISKKLSLKYRMGQHLRLKNNCEHPDLANHPDMYIGDSGSDRD
jgi:hypothetical protein